MRTLELKLSAVGGSIDRLVSCVRSLGPNLGWRYWRIGEKARNHPELITAWATRCRREAIIAPEPYRSAYLQWAEELEMCLENWRGRKAANDPKLSDGGAWRGSCEGGAKDSIQATKKGGSQ